MAIAKFFALHPNAKKSEWQSQSFCVTRKLSKYSLTLVQ